MTNQLICCHSGQSVEYIYDLRGKTMAKYVKAPGAEDDIHR